MRGKGYGALFYALNFDNPKRRKNPHNHPTPPKKSKEKGENWKRKKDENKEQKHMANDYLNNIFWIHTEP